MLGLIIGLTGAIQLSLIAINALGFNRFIPDHSRIYLGVSQLSGPGMPAQPNELTVGLATPLLAANVPQIEAIARLSPQDNVALRLTATERKETIYWGDPGIFSVLRYPALYGNPADALQRPDGLVMTAAEARKWFGTSRALGQRLLVSGKPMMLRAVLRDEPPQQTDLVNGIFASGLSSASPLANLSASAGSFSIDSRTYLRLRSDVDKNAVEQVMAKYVDTLVPAPMRGSYAMKLIRLDQIALDPGLHPGARDQLEIGTLIVVLVLFIATSNFINLSIAMSSRRHREIGIRKVNGANRKQIALQFLGETVALVLVAAIVSLVISEWLIGPVNAFLDTDTRIESLHSPVFLAIVFAGSLLLGIIAGAYPAFVLSSYRPAAILRPGQVRPTSRNWLQTVLVSAQFAILIALIIVTVVIHQQRVYAVTEALRIDIDDVATVHATCPQGFVAEVSRLPGVKNASCSGSELLSGATFAFLNINGRKVPTQYVAVLPSTFGVFGIRPLAGSLDGLPARGEDQMARIVINETAAKRFGYTSADAAVGKSIPVTPVNGSAPVQVTIVAVVPDFGLTSIVDPIKPTIYIDSKNLNGGDGIVLVKLAGDQIAPSLDAIDRIWQQTGQQGVIDRSFLSAHLEELYRSLERNTKLFAFFSAIAIILACLGLIGLSVAAANRRIKEIGVRKAMGASTGRILRLLLWQFSKPVLFANIVAWPLAWWAMRRWLDGFAYRVPLHWWLFPTAGLMTLIVAGLTVGSQSYAAARQRPVKALRYE
jgi:putative ABC transport system permease protein